MKLFGFFLVCLMALGVCAARAEEPATQYLAFQIFTGGFDPQLMRQEEPPASTELRDRVDGIRARVYVPGPKTRRLGFILGPLSLDNTDDEVREIIAAGFGIAMRSDMAVGFHLDDSMFWGRLSQSLNRPGAIEWLDWAGTPSTGRRLDWSEHPVRLMPQLCVNSKGVIDAVSSRARLIGQEIAKGVARLHAAGRDGLYIGVIAGWETQIGRDYKTGKHLGYCALTNAGFSADKPPPDLDRAREDIVRDFIALWAKNLSAGGAPQDKIYSHTVFTSATVYNLTQHLKPQRQPPTYMEAVNATPPGAAFGPGHAPGFTVYTEIGQLEDIDAELAKNGRPGWIAAKAVPLVPPEAGAPLAIDMERFLGNLFGHGARVVNIFGWGDGDPANRFRRQAESMQAVLAYKKFLRGHPLHAAPLPLPEVPSDQWVGKMQRIERDMPGYISRNGIGKVRKLMERMDAQSRDLKFMQAEKTADQILAIIRQ